MGEILLKFYKYIAEEKGINGRTELAKKTKIASIIAANEPDSEDNIRNFKKAVEEITGKPAPEF